MTHISESCPCGARYEINDEDREFVKRQVKNWRDSHKHDPQRRSDIYRTLYGTAARASEGTHTLTQGGGWCAPSGSLYDPVQPLEHNEEATRSNP